MTTVIKVKKQERVKSLSSVLTQAFAKHRKSFNRRTIEVSCTPQAYTAHGDKWFSIAKQQMAEVAKARGLTISAWDERVKDGVPTLDVHFNQVLSAFHQDFQADLLEDLTSPSYKGNFDAVSVKCKGDENGGTLLIELDTTEHDYATARPDLRRVLKSLFADTYHKQITGMGNMKSEDPNRRTLTITYKDVPY